jgi:predicted DNA-binding transcriptional regulator AlpA
MSELNTVEPEMVSVNSLARCLDISKKTIWDWIYKSRRRPTSDPIPYHKLGSLVRFNLHDVRAWIQRRKVCPVAAGKRRSIAE